MKNKFKIIGGILLISFIALLFVIRPNNIEAAYSYNTQKISDSDGTEVYEAYITLNNNTKFNYTEFKLELNHLSLTSIEPLGDFQMVKDDRENLTFALASNTIYSYQEAFDLHFVKLTFKRDVGQDNCTFNIRPITTSTVPVNDFNLNKRAMKDDQEITSIYEGEEFKYVIDITGNNTLETDNLVVKDTIPDELIIVDAKTASQNGQELTWNLGKQAAGSYSKTLEVIVKAKESVATNKITNVAILTVGPNEKRDDAIVDVYHPKIKITKVVNKKKANIGDEIYYDITVQNIGTGVAKNIEVTDTYNSKYLTYERSDFNVTKNSVEENTVLSFTIDSLASNESKTVRLYFIVNNGFSENVIPNVAKATYKDQIEQDDEEVTVLRPDLNIEKTVSKATLKRKETFTYNIKISNSGDGIAKNVVVSDTISSYFELLSASYGNINGNSFEATYEALGPNESKTITLTVKVKDDAPLISIDNIATVKSDNTPSKNDDVLVNIVDSKITITKSTNKNILKPNEEFIYTLVVKNIGDAVAQNITVKDVINSNLEIVDSNGANINGNTLTWIINELAVNESVTYNIKVRVKSKTPNMIIPNIATAQEEGKDEVESNVDVEVKNPILNITKVASLKNIKPGEEFSYTIKVTNTGEIASNEVIITDEINDLLSIVSADGGSVNGQTITWKINSLNPNQEITYIVKVRLNENAKEGTKIKNVVVLKHDDEEKNAEDDVTVIKDDLYIIKEANKDKVRVGEEFSYTIKIGNRGTSIANNVVVKDPILNNLEVLSYSSTKGTITLNNNNIQVDVGSLNINEEVFITINVRVIKGNKDEQLINTATLTSDDVTLDSSDDVVIIDTDVVIEKTSSVSQVYNGEDFYYTITVTNRGDISAYNLEVVDTIDPLLSVIDANGGIVKDNTITWNIEELEPNQSINYIIKVKTINSKNGDIIENKVVLHEINKPDKEDDAQVVVKDIKFSIHKEVNKDKVYKGEEFIYTIIVKNESSVAVNDVMITDQLDSNLIIVDTDAINNDGILTWVDNFAPEEEKRYTIKVKTNTDIEVNQVVNAALLTYQDHYTDSNQVIVTLEDLENPQTGSYINYLFICLGIISLVLIYLRINKRNKIYKI